MSWPILNIAGVEALEHTLMSRGTPLSELIARAVSGCAQWFEHAYPAAEYPTVGLLVGRGHNGADALGIGVELALKGRKVFAVIPACREQLKPATAQALDKLSHTGAIILPANEWDSDQSGSTENAATTTASVWIDGLYGFGLNRGLGNDDYRLVQHLNNSEKPIVSLDIPSGLNGDFGHFSDDRQAAIRATETLAIGCLKPVHTLDACLDNLGQVHLIDMNYREAIQSQKIISTASALLPDDLPVLLKKLRRPAAAHKYKSGRLLIIAGSQCYPGAAVMCCLGATVSGAGMIHALIPEHAQTAILQHAPEVIFEQNLPDLSRFDAIVLGPGWVPGSDEVFAQILVHVRIDPTCRLVLDAGAFKFLHQTLSSGNTLNENCILTPHAGEFERLFPDQAADVKQSGSSRRTTVIEAALAAAKKSKASVYLKGARSYLAHPDGTVHVILKSSPLLATAGHGDVLAGLLGGLLARGANCETAAQVAALLQSCAALNFEKRHPLALTLSPLELVHEMRNLRFKS